MPRLRQRNKIIRTQDNKTSFFEAGRL